jgi:hypothetical protein
MSKLLPALKNVIFLSVLSLVIAGALPMQSQADVSVGCTGDSETCRVTRNGTTVELDGNTAVFPE